MGIWGDPARFFARGPGSDALSPSGDPDPVGPGRAGQACRPQGCLYGDGDADGRLSCSRSSQVRALSSLRRALRGRHGLGLPDAHYRRLLHEARNGFGAGGPWESSA